MSSKRNKKQELPLTFEGIRRVEIHPTRKERLDMLNFIKSNSTRHLIDVRNISGVNHIYLPNPEDFSQVINGDSGKSPFYEVHTSYQEDFDIYKLVVFIVSIEQFGKYCNGTWEAPVKILSRKPY